VWSLDACAYGTFSMLMVELHPSASPTPLPDVLNRRVVPGAPDAVGPAVLFLGFMATTCIVAFVYSLWHKRAREEWPWEEAKERYRAWKGDKVAIRRLAQKKRWRDKGLSVKVGARR
jgi:hypothetical protein